MQFRNVGRSGLKVSVAGLGCNNFGRLAANPDGAKCAMTEGNFATVEALATAAAADWDEVNRLTFRF